MDETETRGSKDFPGQKRSTTLVKPHWECRYPYRQGRGPTPFSSFGNDKQDSNQKSRVLDVHYRGERDNCVTSLLIEGPLLTTLTEGKRQTSVVVQPCLLYSCTPSCRARQAKVFGEPRSLIKTSSGPLLKIYFFPL